MKRSRKISLAIIIPVVGVLLLGGWYGYKFSRETSKMHPCPTQEIVDGVYALNDDFVNMYLLKNDAGYIAIDAGNNQEKILGQMDKLGIDPADVTTILLTHTDSDHVGAVELFPQAKVYIAADEVQMVDGQTPRAAFFIKNKLTVPYETITDQENLDINGLSVTGIALPGHTPGSMAYIVDGQYLFTGDTLGLVDGQAVTFNEFFNMDTTMEEKSIRKLAKVKGIAYLFTGHYGYTDDYALAMENWF